MDEVFRADVFSDQELWVEETDIQWCRSYAEKIYDCNIVIG